MDYFNCFLLESPLLSYMIRLMDVDCHDWTSAVIVFFLVCLFDLQFFFKTMIVGGKFRICFGTKIVQVHELSLQSLPWLGPRTASSIGKM